MLTIAVISRVTSGRLKASRVFPALEATCCFGSNAKRQTEQNGGMS